MLSLAAAPWRSHIIDFRYKWQGVLLGGIMLDEYLRDRFVPVLITRLAFSLQLTKIVQNLCPICRRVPGTVRSVNLAAFYGR